ncbi:MAG: 30S ribosomal protein S8 [Clostridiaceae bacterium]|jgi:small subunit ribosomal protein S8|nr:30S ribosomal protein S8 [Clostridiaceae bacterium]
MSVTDPIADMLTRVRNALTARKETVLVPASKIKTAIAEILVREGYIKSFETVEKEVQNDLVLTLKYAGKTGKVITGLKRISKPGLRVYVEADNVPKVLNGLGIAILSTSKGIITDREARTANTGGEVLAFIW